MHAGRRFLLTEVIYWTRRDLYIFAIVAFVPTALFYFFNIRWLVIPWVAIGLVGTAAAFVAGFKNTQTYSRLWEARQVWGSIINTSRTWGVMVRDTVTGDQQAVQELIYRHFAWLTALRYQMREPRVWENMLLKSNLEYATLYKVPERETLLEDELKKFLSPDEQQYVLSKKNRTTQLISLQSQQLKNLQASGKVTELVFLELQKLLSNFYDHQGRSERIKNFPYPRQFATINQMFIRLFVCILPFGILQEVGKLSLEHGRWFVWLTVPFSLIVGWVFYIMERIGESTENPFEGGPNDVPISNISRTIEIDLREMLDEINIPAPVTAQNNILL